MKIYFLTNKTASRVWRMIPQARHMVNCGHEVQVDEYAGQFDLSKIIWADVIVCEMVFDSRIYEAAHDHGKKIIYEIDDIQEVTHKKHYAYAYTHGWQGLRRRWFMYRMMAKADAFIVTNKQLKNRYQWLTKVGKKKKIFVMPNYMDMMYFNVPTILNNSGKFRIVWAGGNSHDVDLEFIYPVLKKFLAKYENAEFVYMGHGGWSSDNPWVEYMYGKHFFKDIPHKQQKFELGVPWPYYPAKLATLQGSVGIAPLVDNTFARYKTPIKAMEYGINFMPTIGSRFLYKDVIIHGETGYLADTQDDFYKYLCMMIEDQEKTKTMGEKAHDHILKNFDIKDHLNEYRQIYEYVYKSN